MSMTTYIVECSVCRTPFEVESLLMPVSVPPAAVIRVPKHDIPTAPGARCMGCDAPGIGMGKKDNYRPRTR
jgi:hypothetical protein